MFILRDDNEEDFIYTVSVPVGLPLIRTFEGTDMRSVNQDSIGVTIKLNNLNDNFTYHFDKKYSKDYKNLRVETEDNVILINMVPSEGSVSDELYMSSIDRRYIRNQQSYLVYNSKGDEKRKRLIKIKVLPDIK